MSWLTGCDDARYEKGTSSFWHNLARMATFVGREANKMGVHDVLFRDMLERFAYPDVRIMVKPCK